MFASIQTIQSLCFLVAHLVSQVSCQVLLPGNCPIKTSAELFNLKEIHGNWYELERSPILFEFALKCVSIRVQQFFNQQAQIQVTSINRFTGVNHHHVLTMVASPDFHYSGKLTQLTQNDTNTLELEKFVFQILATDYKNYLILWGCQNFVSTAHSELLWIFGRTHHHLGNHFQTNIMDKMRASGLAHMKLQPCDPTVINNVGRRACTWKFYESHDTVSTQAELPHAKRSSVSINCHVSPIRTSPTHNLLNI